jgi:hypothetical protein
MRFGRFLFVKIVLLMIAVSLSAIALRLYLAPPPVQAQFSTENIYIEPGTYMLRAPDGNQNVMGRVVVDLRTGNIWGFPTFTGDPYPSTSSSSTPPVSHPFLLGHFALSDMSK